MQVGGESGGGSRAEEVYGFGRPVYVGLDSLPADLHMEGDFILSDASLSTSKLDVSALSSWTVQYLSFIIFSCHVESALKSGGIGEHATTRKFSGSECVCRPHDWLPDL